VKWGPFFDHNVRTLTYEVSGVDAVYTLAGVGSFDGASKTTVGDELAIIGDGDLHLADMHMTTQGDLFLTWSSTAGRQYRLEKSTNLVEGVWLPVDTFSATPPENEYTYDLGPERCLFLRIISWKP